MVQRPHPISYVLPHPLIIKRLRRDVQIKLVNLVVASQSAKIFGKPSHGPCNAPIRDEEIGIAA